MLALPKELNLNQQIELATQFAQTHFVNEGIPTDLAIHDHGDGNPHAHLLITTRRLEKNRFSTHKARDLNPNFAKKKIVEKEYWGELWRAFQNDLPHITRLGAQYNKSIELFDKRLYFIRQIRRVY